ncbi:TPA: prophage tail fiber N-terminal domain-containing protein, partial [Salmonella enterica subsp. enterica serovar Muenchen]
MPIISGTLTDGAGQPIAGCTIQLKALNTTSAVIRTTTARVGVTAGVYRIEAQPARYEVTLAVEDYPPQKVGAIDIYADSPDGTLNDFLTATKAEYLTPDVMNQFKLLAQQSREAAEAAGVASRGISAIKDAAEKAASNAALSENNASASARAARTSEINAAGSVTQAAASAAAALVSQNAAKTSEDAASASAVKASVSEVNAYYSAAAALASQKAAKVSEDAAKASQIASTASADSASASAMSAQGNATKSAQAVTDAIAAKDAAVAQVTGFDAHVSQQKAVITQAVDSATTKANADIAAATDINRNNAIQAINQKQAEATSAIQAGMDAA